jgi:hypothetical protein
MDQTVPPRPDGRLSWRRWLPKAVFESLLIVFSVILALGLSDWAESRRTAARVQEMRGHLIGEMRANRALLVSDAYLPHHRQLKTAFGRATGMPGAPIGRAEARPAIDQLFKGGLHQPPLQDAVWSSVVGGDLLEHLPAEDLFTLARVYRAQSSTEELNRIGAESAAGLLDVLADESLAPRQMMRMTLFLEDMVYHEERMVALYDQALKQLAGDPGADPRGAANQPVTAAPQKG